MSFSPLHQQVAPLSPAQRIKRDVQTNLSASDLACAIDLVEATPAEAEADAEEFTDLPPLSPAQRIKRDQSQDAVDEEATVQAALDHQCAMFGEMKKQIFEEPLLAGYS